LIFFGIKENNEMLNTFVKTPEQIAYFQNGVDCAHISRHRLMVEFETTNEFIRELLPPCFDLQQKAMGVVSVAKVQSEYDNTEFNNGALAFSCRYKGKNCSYITGFWFDSESPLYLGREIFGEPKKFGNSDIYMCGHDMYAFVDRMGDRILEIEGNVDNILQPDTRIQYEVMIKGHPHVYGGGFQNPPLVFIMEGFHQNCVVKQGTGKIRFHSGRYDKLDQIPVINVGKAEYVEGIYKQTVKEFEPLFETEKYLPYIYGTSYDLFTPIFSPTFFNDDFFIRDY
jgi:acetoacetate decarboxylase